MKSSVSLFVCSLLGMAVCCVGWIIVTIAVVKRSSWLRLDATEDGIHPVGQRNLADGDTAQADLSILSTACLPYENKKYYDVDASCIFETRLTTNETSIDVPVEIRCSWDGYLEYALAEGGNCDDYGEYKSTTSAGQNITCTWSECENSLYRVQCYEVITGEFGDSGADTMLLATSNCSFDFCEAACQDAADCNCTASNNEDDDSPSYDDDLFNSTTCNPCGCQDCVIGDFNSTVILYNETYNCAELNITSASSLDWCSPDELWRLVHEDCQCRNADGDLLADVGKLLVEIPIVFVSSFD